jgi:hypothetical protein
MEGGEEGTLIFWVKIRKKVIRHQSGSNSTIRGVMAEQGNRTFIIKTKKHVLHYSSIYLR